MSRSIYLILPKQSTNFRHAGARIYLNPFSPTFDLKAASRHLSFAAKFTPQYGDSFLEQLRLNMIDQWLIPLATPFITSMVEAFLLCKQMSINDAYQFIADHTKKSADAVKAQLEDANPISKDVLDTSDLELRCSSADPNYGLLWFRCRSSPIDTAREVIEQAKVVMTDSIIQYSHLYVAAMVRRAGLLTLIQGAERIAVQDPELKSIFGRGLPHPNSQTWDAVVDRQLRSAPPLDKMIPQSGADSALFTTGCAVKNQDWKHLSLEEKRKVLFGSDSLLS